MKQVLVILMVLHSLQTAAQDTLAQDTSYLSLEQMMKMTLSYHPIVKQANLLSMEAESKLKQARGGYDPKVQLDYSLKDFKETEYYNLVNTTFKVPTWLGIDPKVEFSQSKGEFVNDQLEIPLENDYQQVAVGFSMPIGKGLFFDERRNIVKQAKAFQEIASAEQTKAVNKILFVIIKDYWNWYLAHQKMHLLSQAVDLSKNLFERTMIDYEFGEAAVVDTLQAKINFQKRMVDYRKSKLNLELAILNLSKHLWSENLTPLILQSNVLPDSISIFVSPSASTLKGGIEYAITNHPEIGKLVGKQAQLDSEMKWARESLKPQIDLSYSLIDAPVNARLENESIDLGENYKMGVDFSFPILLRKERGKLQQTKLKILSNEYQLVQNQLSIKNEVMAKYAQSLAYADLANQYARISANYKRLLDAEVINLQNGETDLFKLNIQQDKYIEAQTEYYDAFVKWEKSKANYFHATGRPLLGLAALFDFVTNQ